MHVDPAIIDAMFARHGIPGPWEALPATGIANRIFATRDVVLRVATDHPEAVPDARTESIAAPVAHAAGILTPRLIAFDDTRALIDRPFSLWERVHAESLGAVTLSPRESDQVWRSVGRELAKLHLRVRECADPHGYLDQPSRDQDFGPVLRELVAAQTLTVDAARPIEQLAAELQGSVTSELEARFVHDDIHPMNVMCSQDGELAAILDWGDAGWGDPALDFGSMPLDAIRPSLEGYAAETMSTLDASFFTRVAWYKLLADLEDLGDRPGSALDVAAYRRLIVY